MSSTRKSPKESATIFKEGVIRTGLDGNEWIVKKIGSSQRWVKYNEGLDGLIVKNMPDYYFDTIDIDKLTKSAKLKFKKIATIHIDSSNVGIGEYIFKIYPAKKGDYLIYKFKGSYIFCPADTNIDSLVFKQYKDDYIYSEAGTTAIINVKNIKNKIKKISSKGKKQLPGYYEFSDKDVNTFNTYSQAKQYSTLRGSHFNSDNLKELIGFFLNNDFGDGQFQLLRDKSHKSFMSISPDLDEYLSDKYFKT